MPGARAAAGDQAPARHELAPARQAVRHHQRQLPGAAWKRGAEAHHGAPAARARGRRSGGRRTGPGARPAGAPTSWSGRGDGLLFLDGVHAGGRASGCTLTSTQPRRRCLAAVQREPGARARHGGRRIRRGRSAGPDAAAAGAASRVPSPARGASVWPPRGRAPRRPTSRSPPARLGRSRPRTMRSASTAASSQPRSARRRTAVHAEHDLVAAVEARFGHGAPGAPPAACARPGAASSGTLHLTSARPRAGGGWRSASGPSRRPAGSGTRHRVGNVVHGASFFARLRGARRNPLPGWPRCVRPRRTKRQRRVAGLAQARQQGPGFVQRDAGAPAVARTAQLLLRPKAAGPGAASASAGIAFTPTDTRSRRCSKACWRWNCAARPASPPAAARTSGRAVPGTGGAAPSRLPPPGRSVRPRSRACRISRGRPILRSAAACACAPPARAHSRGVSPRSTGTQSSTVRPKRM
jgi:hypothetical protein